MFRVASIGAIVLLGTFAGCRGTPPTSRVSPRAETSVATLPQPSRLEQAPSQVRTVAFDEAAGEVDARSRQFGGWESLPTPGSDDSHEAPLTISDLEGIALANNPTLVAARARIDVARGRQLQAGLFPNPVAGYHATEIGNQGTAGQQGAFVNQRIITGGKLRLDQAIAGREIQGARFQLQAQQQRVLSDARVRFYDALVAQRRVELTNELAGIGEQLVRATNKLLEGRLATENDLLQAQIRAGESDILFDNSLNQREEAWRRLAAVAGVPTMQIMPLAGELDGELPQLDWEQCYAIVLGGNPQLNAARSRVQRARTAALRARREPIPNVDVFVSVRHHNVTSDEVANVQVGIPIPVFDRNQGNLRSAEAQWMAARAEVGRIELDLQDRLAVAYRRYANARQQAERYGHQIVPRAQRSLELVTAGYQQGQVEYLTLLTAQETFLRASLSYLDSLQELWAAAVVIDGQLLTGSLTVGGLQPN